MVDDYIITNVKMAQVQSFPFQLITKIIINQLEKKFDKEREAALQALAAQNPDEIKPSNSSDGTDNAINNNNTNAVPEIIKFQQQQQTMESKINKPEDEVHGVEGIISMIKN